MNAYAISDIHGCLRTFQALLRKLNLQKGDQLFLLGDFINKGPDSVGVLDLILELLGKGFSLHCLLGNHDETLLRLKSGAVLQAAEGSSSDELTLHSFAVDHPQEIPERYYRFMEGLPTVLTWKDYLFVHAGFNFAHEDPLSDKYAHTHIRQWYHQVDRRWLGDRMIVHGHEQQSRSAILAQLDSLPSRPILGIDAGCVSVWESGKGYLCAFDLVRKKCIFQENVE